MRSASSRSTGCPTARRTVKPRRTRPINRRQAPQRSRPKSPPRRPRPITPAPGDADPTPPAATADTDPELAAFETPRLVAELERRGFRHLPAKRARPTATATEPRRSKNAELDAAAARGIVPAKPDVTSHANHHYQKRFNRLAELAEAGDWDAVRAYECTGVNSYAKMVRQYRDRLLVAHAASTPAA